MSPSSENPLKRLIGEIHRRSLWQVVLIYAGVSWLVFEIVQTLTEGLGLPDWFPPLAFVLLLIGLPVVLATAVVQEGGPAPTGPGSLFDAGGHEIRRGGEASASGSGVHRVLTWRNAILGGVGAFALFGIVAAGWLLFVGPDAMPGSSPPDPGEGRPSLAVLPFENMSADEENRYFSDGLTEELLNALANVPGLQVAARTSSFALRGQGLDVRQAGQRLGVAYVVEGSVRKADDHVRITAQLVRADNGFHLWSDTYDRQLRDIFAVQDEIARSIARTLRIRLVGDSTLVPQRTESPRAHDLYLLGLAEWNRRTVESLHRAVGYFEDATAEDPGFARAHAGLALAALLVPMYDPEVDPSDWMERARAAAERALALDPGSAEAHTALGDIAWLYDYDPAAAEAAYRSAIAANPSYATAHQWYGDLLMAQGRHEDALARLERAVALDPLSLIANTIHGLALLLARGPEPALARLGRALEIDPRFGLAHTYSGIAHLVAGRRDSAAVSLGAYARYSFGLPPEEVDRVAAAIRDPEARGADARAALAGWADGEILLPSLAVFHAAVGDYDGALTRLEQAVVERTSNLGLVVAYPLFDPVRDDPRFQAILERMGLLGG